MYTEEEEIVKAKFHVYKVGGGMVGPVWDYDTMEAAVVAAKTEAAKAAVGNKFFVVGDVALITKPEPPLQVDFITER